MKKILLPLLALVLICLSVTALAEGGDEITLELAAAKLPLYEAGDPALEGLTEEAALRVLVLPVKRSFQLSVKVLPATVKNKKITLSVDNEEAVRVKGNSVTGVAPGEALLTIASVQDPNATLQIRIVVVQLVTRLTLTPSEKTVPVGGTITLTPTYIPENATTQKVAWDAGNGAILTVDENGVVTGVKRGTGRVTATATDGSKIRATLSIRVTQSAEEITLNNTELTVDVKKSAVLKATVLPKDTDNKKVIWTSSDESVATVNRDGRVTGVALGDCEITCTSQDSGDVQAKATVHVQQPVTKIVFGPEMIVYKDEPAQLSVTVEPENASNPVLKFTSSNQKILSVSEDGTVTGLAAGEAFVNAVTTDGSNRKARLKVRVMQHLTSVHMLRKTAYIDTGASNDAGAILEPAKFVNNHMTWESADPSVATVMPLAKTPNRVRITGKGRGETTVTGTTEDGGLQTSIVVKVGDFEKSLKLVDAWLGDKYIVNAQVKNVSDLTITSIKLECRVWDDSGNPLNCNTKDGGNMFTAIYNKPLNPGQTTRSNDWKLINYQYPVGPTDPDRCEVRLVEFTIENDWVKLIRKNKQQSKICLY